MTGAITVTAPRTFVRTFLVLIKLCFTTPSGYRSIATMFGVITLAFSLSSPLWLAALAGGGWVVAMLPCMFALQAWRVVRNARDLGAPVFTFDESGAACANGAIVTRVPWSAISRLSFDARTCFVYVTPRSAWFFARDLLSKDDEAALSEFARRSAVRLTI